MSFRGRRTLVRWVLGQCSPRATARRDLVCLRSTGQGYPRTAYTTPPFGPWFPHARAENPLSHVFPAKLQILPLLEFLSLTVPLSPNKTLLHSSVSILSPCCTISFFFWSATISISLPPLLIEYGIPEFQNPTPPKKKKHIIHFIVLSRILLSLS